MVANGLNRLYFSFQLKILFIFILKITQSVILDINIKIMGRLQVAIDRGGTFTDVVARTSDGKIITMKLLSEDPEKYKDAPTEAIRRLLKQVIFFNVKE